MDVRFEFEPVKNVKPVGKYNGEAVNLAVCPECGQRALVVENGCYTCLSCGFSRCDL